MPTYSIIEGVLAQKVGDETVILNSNTELYLSLNEVGTRIWQLIEEGKSSSEMSEILVDEYDVSLEQAKEDIRLLIVALFEKKLITESSA